MVAAGGDGGELAVGGVGLVLVVAAPALDGSVVLDAARVLGAGGDRAVLALGIRRRVKLAIEVVPPAVDRAGSADSAGVVAAGGDGGELATGLAGLPAAVVAPA